MNTELLTPSKLKEFGKDYVKILAQEILRAGKNASGKLIKSLNYKLKKDGEAVLLVIESEKYLEFIDKGRRKGTYPPIKPLLEWTRIKGMNKGAAYAIQKSIFKFGIPPTNIISKVVNRFETSDELRTKYETTMVEAIIKQINDNKIPEE